MYGQADWWVVSGKHGDWLTDLWCVSENFGEPIEEYGDFNFIQTWAIKHLDAPYAALTGCAI